MNVLTTSLCLLLAATLGPAAAQESESLKHYRDGIEQLKNRNFRNATIELEKAAATDAGNGKIFYALGQAYEALSEYDKAVGAYETTLSLGQYQDRIPKRLAKLYYKSGIDLYSQKKYADAVQGLQKSLKYSERNAQAHFAIGLCQISLRDEAAAQQAFEEAIKADAKYVKAHKALGDIHYRKREYASAMAEYEKAIAIDAGFVKAYGGLGRALIDSGDLEGAAKRMAAAVEQNTQYADGHLFQGLALVKLQRFHEAVPPLRRAIELDGKNAEAHYRLAEALYGKGEYRKAIQSGEQALRRRKDFHAAEVVLGDSFAKLGQVQEARTWYNRALRDNRFRDYAQHQLDELDAAAQRR